MEKIPIAICMDLSKAFDTIDHEINLTTNLAAGRGSLPRGQRENVGGPT